MSQNSKNSDNSIPVSISSEEARNALRRVAVSKGLGLPADIQDIHLLHEFIKQQDVKPPVAALLRKPVKGD